MAEGTKTQAVAEAGRHGGGLDVGAATYPHANANVAKDDTAAAAALAAEALLARPAFKAGSERTAGEGSCRDLESLQVESLCHHNLNLDTTGDSTAGMGSADDGAAAAAAVAAIKAAPIDANAFDKVDAASHLTHFQRHLRAMFVKVRLARLEMRLVGGRSLSSRHANPLEKRMLYFVRDRRSIVFIYVIPVIFVLTGMLVMKVGI